MVWLSGNVLASIIVVALRQTHFQPKSSGLVLSRRPLGAVLHSSYEPGELSQWLSHDDSTINIVLDIIIIIIIIDILEKCTTAIHQWLLHNGLQLNPSKPKAILFTTGRGQLYDIPSLQVSDTVIQMSATIKRLGVTLDHHLTFDQHVANVCKACYFHICSTVSQVSPLPEPYLSRHNSQLPACLYVIRYLSSSVLCSV